MTQEPKKDNTVLIVVAIIGVVGTIIAATIGAVTTYNVEKIRQETELTRIAMVSNGVTQPSLTTQPTAITEIKVDITETSMDYAPTYTATPSKIVVSHTVYNVSALERWQNTGIQAIKGDEISVQYLLGLWTWSEQGQPQMFDGEGDLFSNTAEMCSLHDIPLLNENTGALIGQVGGNIFRIGNSLIFNVPSNLTGNQTLYLRMNDCDGGFYDNGGSIDVGITVSR